MRSRTKPVVGVLAIVVAIATALWLVARPGPEPAASSTSLPEEVASRPEPFAYVQGVEVRTIAIVDAKTAAPVPRAALRVLGQTPTVAWANAAGEVTWSAADPVRVVISAAGYPPQPARIDSGTEFLRIHRGGHNVSGVVRDLYGGTVPGAIIRTGDALALTDDEGRYTLSVPSGNWNLQARGEDYFPQSRLVYVTDDARINFELLPGGAIEGLVVDEGGDPVASAWVNYSMLVPRVGGFSHRGTRDEQRVQTDASGRFRLAPLAPANYQVVANTDDASTVAPAAVRVALLETRDDIRLVVRRGSTARGRVIGDDGEPIKNASVYASHRSGSHLDARTDGTGQFEIRGLYPGTWSLSARAKGGSLVEAVKRVVRTGSDVPTAELVLTRGGRIEGRVPSGRGARVSLELPRTSVGFSDFARRNAVRGESRTVGSDGTFVFESVPSGAWQVHARMDDGRSGSVTLDLEPDGQADVEVDLVPGATVRGVVENRRGDLDGLRVRLRGPVELAAVSLDEGGAFAIEHAPAGSWTIDVQHRGSSIPIVQGDATIVVEDGQAPGAQLVVDTVATELSGRVIDTEGGPVADALIQVSPKGGGEPVSAVSDGDGRFAISTTAAARYRVDVTGPRALGLATQDDVDPDARLEVILQEPASVRGQVLLAGQPVTHFQVRPPRARAFPLFVGDPRGAFELSDLMPGPALISVLADEGVAEVQLELHEGEATDVTFELEPWGAAQGRVVDAEGIPIAGATVRVSSEAGRADGSEDATTDADGNFTLDGLGPGSTVFKVRHGKVSLRTEKQQVAPGDELDLGTLTLDE